VGPQLIRAHVHSSPCALFFSHIIISTTLQTLERYLLSVGRDFLRRSRSLVRRRFVGCFRLFLEMFGIDFHGRVSDEGPASPGGMASTWRRSQVQEPATKMNLSAFPQLV